jgi:NADH:ubiquinone oxidoreductase subunit 3 (subunit A)
MLEFILDQFLVLGQIYIILGLLVTFTFLCINYITRDKETEFTFIESLGFIFFYPVILYYAFNKKDNE